MDEHPSPCSVFACTTPRSEQRMPSKCVVLLLAALMGGVARADVVDDETHGTPQVRAGLEDGLSRVVQLVEPASPDGHLEQWPCDRP